MMTYQDACFAIEICRIVFAAVCGDLVLFAAKAVYMRLPAHWLCDFDEQPWEMHMPGFRGQRCKVFCAGLWSVLLIFIVRVQHELEKAVEDGAVLIAVVDIVLTAGVCICAVVIAFGDRDYMIIPDQLVMAMGILVVIFRLSSAIISSGSSEFLSADMIEAVHQILFGAFIGGSLMMITGFAGLISGNGFAAGFGDIKLMAVCGAMVGENVYIMYVLIVMMSGIYFSYCIVRGKVRSSEGLPLAPWICGAMLLCM